MILSAICMTLIIILFGRNILSLFGNSYSKAYYCFLIIAFSEAVSMSLFAFNRGALVFLRKEKFLFLSAITLLFLIFFFSYLLRDFQLLGICIAFFIANISTELINLSFLLIQLNKLKKTSFEKNE